MIRFPPCARLTRGAPRPPVSLRSRMYRALRYACAPPQQGSREPGPSKTTNRHAQSLAVTAAEEPFARIRAALQWCYLAAPARDAVLLDDPHREICRTRVAAVASSARACWAAC